MQLPLLVEVDNTSLKALALPHAARWAAALELVASMQRLSERGSQVVQQMVGGELFREWHHYPDDDVRDNKRASQYFYHAHPGLQRPFQEHGHFHLFVHADTLGLARRRAGSDPEPAHLVAVSMDAHGLPNGFFAVNRWVTKGPWLSYAACENGLTAFAVKGRRSVPEINGFLKALLTLYRGHILRLLQERDALMQKLCAGRDRRSVFADKGLEVLCYLPIQLLDDISALEGAA